MIRGRTRGVNSFWFIRSRGVGGLRGGSERESRGGSVRVGWWEWLMGWAFFPVRLIISTINELTQLLCMSLICWCL